MASYYDSSDFCEYTDFFIQNKLDMKEFIDALNLVVDENESVCDTFIILNKIYDVSKDVFNHLRHLMKNDNMLAVYLYCKFLLLEKEKKKIYIDSYIIPICNLHKHFKENTKSMQDIIKFIYIIKNDDTLENFIDYTNNFGVYKSLDIQSIENVSYEPNSYLKNNFIVYFVKFVRIYIRMSFFYKLNYYFSQEKSTLKSDEVSVTGIEDFLRRFEMNSDTYMILWNYFFVSYEYIRDKNPTQDKIQEIIHSIPANKKCKRCSPDITLNMKKKMECIRQICYYIIVYDNSGWDDSFYELSSLSFHIFLNTKFGYDESMDEYNLFKYMNYNKKHSDILLHKVSEYFNSKIYLALQKIYIVHEHLDKTKENRYIELSQFLCKVLNSMHFTILTY